MQMARQHLTADAADGCPKYFLGGFHQGAEVAKVVTQNKGTSIVSVVTIQLGGNIDVDQVAIFKPDLIGGDAMTNLVV